MYLLARYARSAAITISGPNKFGQTDFYAQLSNKESLQNCPASWRSTDENKKIRNRMIREHRIIKLSILYLHLSASHL